MTVPTAFSDLSTTPATNSGLISGSSSPTVIDDHFQAVYAFIASVYANSGNSWTSPYLTTASPSYTGTLTGGTGIVNLGSGQFYKAASGRVGLNTTSPGTLLHVEGGGLADIALRMGQSGVVNWDVTHTSAGVFGIGVTAGVYLFSMLTDGTTIQRASSSVPTLTAANQLVMNLTSDTNLRISVRGSDGTTRVANITLA